MLQSLKAENSKFKSELDAAKSNLELFERSLKKSGNVSLKNLNAHEFAQNILIKEVELNTYKGILHNSIASIREIFENSNDEFANAFTEILYSSSNSNNGNKTLEEKFKNSFEKFIKYYEVNILINNLLV